MGETKIDWADLVVNPWTGCKYACPYCYGEGFAKRFNEGNYEPEFHPERVADFLQTKVQGKRVFVCSVADLFGPWIPKDKIQEVLEMCRAKEEGSNVFLFLTKNPARYADFSFTPTEWTGTTLDLGVESAAAPPVRDRLDALVASKHPNRFLSIEPFSPGTAIVDAYRAMFERIDRSGIKWIIVGLQTPVRVKDPAKKASWKLSIGRLLSDLQELFPGVPVFCKSSVHAVMNFSEVPHQFPAGFPVTKKRVGKKRTAA